jgi:glycosyltransferase involved in cell wall biosynthesis
LVQGDRLGEIIVVDDGSTDDSPEVLERIRSELAPGLLQIFRNPGKGANDARNYGFAQASGAFIQWLDADDFLLPGKFDRQIAAFLEQPEADVIYSDWCEELRDFNGEVRERRIHELRSYDDFARELVADNWSVPASYLIRRPMAERLHELRAWNPRTRVAQDREYITVAALIGAGFAYAPGVFSIYNRWNPNSTSSMPFKERLGHQLELELRFRDLILSSDLSNKKKKQYISLLNSHSLNACYYNPSLTIRRPFWIGDVDLSIVDVASPRAAEPSGERAAAPAAS